MILGRKKNGVRLNRLSEHSEDIETILTFLLDLQMAIPKILGKNLAALRSAEIALLNYVDSFWGFFTLKGFYLLSINSAYPQIPYFGQVSSFKFNTTKLKSDPLLRKEYPEWVPQVCGSVGFLKTKWKFKLIFRIFWFCDLLFFSVQLQNVQLDTTHGFK